MNNNVVFGVVDVGVALSLRAMLSTIMTSGGPKLTRGC
jgi:hypothetical protein